MKNIGLTAAWNMKKSAHAYVRKHSHDYHELVYYVYANGRTEIGDAEYDFSSGSFAVISGGKAHDEYHNIDSNIICIGFCGDTELCDGVYSDKDGAVLDVIKVILSESTEQKSGYEDMLYAKLCEMTVLTSRLSHKSGGTHTVKDYTYAMSYIRENLDEKNVLKKAASGFYQSYDYFRHCFKAQMGVSPREYLMKCRFDSASRLLRDTDLGCTEISYRCGFCSGAQFASMFKDKFGCTPSEYRMKIRENT